MYIVGCTVLVYCTVIRKGNTPGFMFQSIVKILSPQFFFSSSSFFPRSLSLILPCHTLSISSLHSLFSLYSRLLSFLHFPLSPSLHPSIWTLSLIARGSKSPRALRLPRPRRRLYPRYQRSQPIWMVVTTHPRNPPAILPSIQSNETPAIGLCRKAQVGFLPGQMVRRILTL